MSEQRKYEVSVEIWDYRFGEIVGRHFIDASDEGNLVHSHTVVRELGPFNASANDLPLPPFHDRCSYYEVQQVTEWRKGLDGRPSPSVLLNIS